MTEATEDRQRRLGEYTADTDTDTDDEAELREELEDLRAEVDALRGVVESTVETVERAVDATAEADVVEGAESTEAEPERGYY